MILQITNKCTRGCNHCMLECTSRGESFMKLSDFKKFITDNSYALNKVLISGGEPLLHPDVVKMIEFCLDNRIMPIVLTSGTNMSVLLNVKEEYKKGVMVQITDDARYYPVRKLLKQEYSKVATDLIQSGMQVELIEHIPTLTKVGRAKDNNLTPLGREYVGCGNALLIPLQSKIDSFGELFIMEDVNDRSCLFMLDFDMNFYLGECKRILLGNYYSVDLLGTIKYKFDNCRTELSCSGCGKNNIESVDKYLKMLSK